MRLLNDNWYRREVFQNGRAIPFTTMEFDVLYFLISNPNIAFTKEQIYEAVMQDNYTEAAYAIRNIIYRIRSKTGLQNIQSIYGFGYKDKVRCAELRRVKQW